MIQIILSNYIQFPIGILDDEVENLFMLMNPEFIQLCGQKKLNPNKYSKDFILTQIKVNGIWKTNRVPRFLRYWKRMKNDYLLPRGSFFALKPLLKKHRIKYRLIKKRKRKPPLCLNFNGTLKNEMGQNAVKGYSYKTSIIEAPTGSGKTIMALYIAALIQQPFIVVVDTKELLNQWKARIQTFLGLENKHIGHVGGGLIQCSTVTVALIQTLRKNTKILDNYGFLIIDECHSAATKSYGIAVNAFKGEYVLGLSATPTRRDGKTNVMKWLLGEIKTRIRFEGAQRTPSQIKFVKTQFKSLISFQYSYSKALVGLTENVHRNKVIIDTVQQNIDKFGIHLILSQSAKHLQYLFDGLPDALKPFASLLIGSVKEKHRKKIIEKMKTGEIKLILATSQLLGKGFDEPLLSTLHLVTPIKDPGRLTQYIGRVTRIHPDKKLSYVFDYYDYNEHILSRSAQFRSETYKKLGLKRIK